MISKTQLYDLGFEHINEYFQNIVDLYCCGQQIEAMNLINDLSITQKKDFIDYAEAFDIDNFLNNIL